MGDSSVANRYIDSEVFDMVNAVLIAHRPPDCSSHAYPVTTQGKRSGNVGKRAPAAAVRQSRAGAA